MGKSDARDTCVFSVTCECLFFAPCDLTPPLSVARAVAPITKRAPRPLHQRHLLQWPLPWFRQRRPVEARVGAAGEGVEGSVIYMKFSRDGPGR